MTGASSRPDESRTRSGWAFIARLVAGVALVAYPIFVWLGLSAQPGEHGSPRLIALLLLAVVAPAVFVRMRRSRQQGVRGLAAIPLITVVALVASAVLDAVDCLLAVPVAINLVFLAAFGSTLRNGAMPMVERFARLQDPDLTLPQQAWCRAWTVIWCTFFVLNAAVALVLAVSAPLPWWAFYNGLLAYGLIGALLAIEWVLRRRRFPRVSTREDSV